MAYNCKDVGIYFNENSLSSLGFSSDGDFLTITPATDIADVYQDKSGYYSMITKNNNTIGEIKFSVMQGSPLQEFLQGELNLFRVQKDYPDISLKVKIPFEKIEWIMTSAVFTLTPEHALSTKANAREFSLKGLLSFQPLLDNSNIISDTAQGLSNISYNIQSGSNLISQALSSFDSLISNGVSVLGGNSN